MYHSKQEEILNIIRDSDIKTLTTGKDKNGIPFLKHIFELHKEIFGETCSTCPYLIPGYISKLKNYNSKEMKEKKEQSKFELKKGVLLIFAGTSRSYSEANLTDEVALEYLAKNPNRKEKFAKLPKDIDKLIENYSLMVAKKKEAEEKAKADAKAEQEKLEAAKIEKETLFKAKVDVLSQNGFQRLLDKFQKGEKSISIKDLFEQTPDEFDSFLIGNIDVVDATEETPETPAPAEEKKADEPAKGTPATPKEEPKK